MDFDISHLDEALKIITNGTKATSGAVSLIGKVKTLLKTPESASSTELDSIVLELTSQVQDAKLSNLDLKEKLILLREELVKFQYQQSEFDRYELKETPAGDRIYSLKATDQSGEPHHSICPKCKEDGRKSILQGQNLLKCNTCKNSYVIEKNKNRPYAAGIA